MERKDLTRASWVKKRQEAPIYFETGVVVEVEGKGTAKELSKTKQPRNHDAALKNQLVNIKSGHFWVYDLPDWDKKK